MNLAESITLSTIRIQVTKQNTGSSTGVSTNFGTGFFFRFFKDDKSISTIVTNKHIVEDAISGELTFSLKLKNEDLNEKSITTIKIPNFSNVWCVHPNDSVDLCVLQINNIPEIAMIQNEIHCFELNMEDIPDFHEIENSFSRIEDVIVVGYPNGRWDSENNMPIVRKGITATALQLDYENSPEFLVDTAIFKGSSGSPVYVINQSSRASRNSINRPRLVGIIWGHVNNKQELLVKISESQFEKILVEIPSNLGVAIHARELKAFEVLLEERHINNTKLETKIKQMRKNDLSHSNASNMQLSS